MEDQLLPFSLSRTPTIAFLIRCDLVPNQFCGGFHHITDLAVVQKIPSQTAETVCLDLAQRPALARTHMNLDLSCLLHLYNGVLIGCIMK